MSPPSGASQIRGRWTVGASAAAGATALLALTAAFGPPLPPGLGAWADAIINEWIVWFTGLYLAGVAIVAFAERLASIRRQNPGVRDESSRPR